MIVSSYKNLKTYVDTAYNKLLTNIVVEGPHITSTHRSYIIQGLIETPEQIQYLCWCILGFLDEVDEIDLKINSIIGKGEQISKNLKQDLATYFDIGINPPPSQESKDRKRNPLIAEMITHVLVHVNRKKRLFSDWIGDVIACRNPHLSTNDGGLDLIALGCIDKNYISTIGEVKAYENEPSRGFSEACKKFTAVREGVYNREIRGVLSRLSVRGGLSKEELAKNIWKTKSNFGVFVSFDKKVQFNIKKDSNYEEVKKQPPERLFLMVTPYPNMKTLFDSISDQLLTLASSFEK